MPRLALLAPLLLAATASARPPASPYHALKAVAAVERGDRLCDEGKYDEAVREFDAAIRLDPNNANAFRHRGYAHVKKFDWFRARCDFDRAIFLNPTLALLHSNRAGVLRELGEYDQALRDVDEALRLDPTFAAGGAIIKGSICAQKGNWELAIRYFDDAIAREPQNAGAYYGRGATWYLQGYYLRAIADVNKALMFDPKRPDAFAIRGLAHKELKDWTKAKDNLDVAIRLGLKTAIVFTARADTWASRADWERALADLDSALTIDPTDHPALENRSLIRSACPDFRYRDARKAYEDAKRLCELTSWKHARAIGCLANAYAEAGQFHEAIRLQQRVLEFVEAKQWREVRDVLSLYEQKKPYRLPEKK